MAGASHRLAHVRPVAAVGLATVPVSRAAADRDGVHLARHAGSLSDLPAAAAALHVQSGRVDDHAVDGRCDYRRDRDRLRLGPLRTPARDDRRRARGTTGRAAVDRRADVRAGGGWRIPDAVLRAGRLGRRARAYERTLAGTPARFSARVRVSARHAVRRRRAVSGDGDRRALLVRHSRWAASRPLPSSSAASSSASAPKPTASAFASSPHPGAERRPPTRPTSVASRVERSDIRVGVRACRCAVSSRTHRNPPWRSSCSLPGARGFHTCRVCVRSS